MSSRRKFRVIKLCQKLCLDIVEMQGTADKRYRYTICSDLRHKSEVEEFLEVNELGIRLHPRKTYYAPISRGFTFCGWRYTQDKDGTIHVRIKIQRKKIWNIA